MLDIKWLRENPSIAQEALKSRDDGIDLAPLLELERHRREAITQAESLKSEQNRLSREIPELKKKGEPVEELLSRISEIKGQVEEALNLQKHLDDRFQEMALALPNIPHESVPRSLRKEDNQVVKEWGAPPQFSFPMRHHLELGEILGLFDFERGSRISGSGFPIYRGPLARVERALLNFLLDQNSDAGFEVIGLPYLVNRETGITSGQLPKFIDQMYHVTEDDLFLIPTAEIALGGFHRNEILQESDLPLRYTAYTACFRREAGTYGIEERGLVRTHQFNKVELFSLTSPESSYEELERLRRQAETLVEKLGLHYRTTLLVSGDLSQGSSKTYDIEVWLPGQNRYYEVSSCSNCEAYQARRGNIRFRRKEGEKPEFVHTLNGSALATSRLMVALLECNQREDGGVNLPEALHGYLGGMKSLEPQLTS
ncbi:MAG: serine--tRNA ligase [Candidatus Omnitrophica bacterium]|nr:serine--tRNA ligase [Candidatus Omnitrophota bacterium]